MQEVGIGGGAISGFGKTKRNRAAAATEIEMTHELTVRGRR
jgi:hypothetical protein